MIKSFLIVSMTLIFLSGCPSFESAKVIAPKIADKAVDGSYGVVCGMPYKTEQRFLVRKKLSREAIQTFCVRDWQR